MKNHNNGQRRCTAAFIAASVVCARADHSVPSPRRRPWSITRASIRRESGILTPRCQLQGKDKQCTSDEPNSYRTHPFASVLRGGASRQSDLSSSTNDLPKSSAPPTARLSDASSSPSASSSSTYLVSSFKAKGARPYMEDEFIVSNGGKFAAVFDGHGGSAVSRYLRQNLHANLQAALPAAAAAEAITMEGRGVETSGSNERTVDGLDETNEKDKSVQPSNKPVIPAVPSVSASMAALRTAFEKVDNEVQRISHWSFQGSTAVAVLIHEGPPNNSNGSATMKRTLVAANVGDSRAILCRRDGSVLQLTRDHKPNDPVERQRIEASGGSVDWCGIKDDEGNPIEGTGVYRINGNLAVARAIGDRAERPCVSSEVEISTFDISGEDYAGDIILLASDGLWDVMENEDVADFLRSALLGSVETAEDGSRQTHKQWRQIAGLVVSEALRRGSTDNVSAVVILIRE